MSTRAFFLNSTNGAIYGEEEINALGTMTLDPGVVNTVAADWDAWKTAGDLKVGQRGAGANMSVDVAAGWGLVQTTRNTKIFNIFVQNVAIQNLVIAANASGSNRIDAVIARVSRSADPNTLTNNVMTLEVVTGSGVSPLSDGAITSAISGDDFIRLANITVPNGASSIVTGNISDTRTPAKTSKGTQMAPKTLHFRTVTSDPSTPEEGEVWFNSVNHTLNFFNGSVVIQLGGASTAFDPFKVSAQASPDMTVQVAAGHVVFDTKHIALTATNSPTFSAPSNVNEKRIDLLCLDVLGTLSIVTGSATVGTPVAPNYPFGKFVIAEIYLRNGATSIKDTDDTTNGYIYANVRPFFVGGDGDGIFGDGSDGDVTISSLVQLTRDMFYNTLTLANNGILQTNGYRVYAKTIYRPSGSNGYIRNNGGNGGNGTNAPSAVTGGSAGAAGAAAPGVTVPAGVAGSIGIAGYAGNGSNLNGSVGNVGANQSPSFSATNGSAGGKGGDTSSPGIQTGGAAPAGGSSTQTKEVPRSFDLATRLYEISGGSTITFPKPSGGAASGSTGATAVSTGQNRAAGGSGGGGGSGGVLWVAARIINDQSTGDMFASVGGNGGNGGRGDSSGAGNGCVAGSGGGAGGNGGLVIRITRFIVGTATVNVSGGIGGTGGVAWTWGGGAGQAGANGANGGNGLSIDILI